MAKKKFRTERDSMGELQVPANALYGAQTQRAVDNFPISGLPMPRSFIRALGLIKGACAAANWRLELLDEKIGTAIQEAAEAVAEGKYDEHFPIDVFQTGSGTSSNMNANEVIAHLASNESDETVHPQRSRQYEPKLQRCDPYDHPRQRLSGDRGTTASGPEPPCL